MVVLAIHRRVSCVGLKASGLCCCRGSGDICREPLSPWYPRRIQNSGGTLLQPRQAQPRQVHVFEDAYKYGPIRNCQSWSFITVNSQLKFNRLGLYCQVTIWPRKHERKTPSQAFTRSKQIYRIGRSLKFCRAVHCLLWPIQRIKNILFC